MSMTTKTFLMTALALGALGYTTPGQEPADEPVLPYNGPETPAVSPVAAALAKLPCFNGKPASDAKYYIYLESASWCGPCRAEMPKIVKAYADMRADGVELILIGQDTSSEAAQEYLKTFGATFPGVFGRADGVAELPGYTSADYVPHAIMVDAQGNVLVDGHGSLSLRWKKIIADYEQK